MSDTTPPPPPPPPPPSTVPTDAVSTGAPVGKRRSIGLVILLSIVTCGIWLFVWSYQNGEELKQYSKDGLGGVGYLLLMLANIFTAGITAVVVMFLMASEVEKLYRREGKEPPITTIWGLWFLLPIIGNFIWYFRIQSALNDFWTAHGATNSPGV